MNKIFLTYIAFFGSLILFSSCNDDPLTIGVDLMPSSDDLLIKVDYTVDDTSYTETNNSLISHAVYYDSYYYTSYENDSSQVFGDYNDAVFGRKTSHLLYQVYPTFSGSIPRDVSADSLILYFQVDSVLLGNRNEPQNFEIFWLNKELSADSVYFSNTDYSDYKGVLITSGSYTPNTKLLRFPINNDNIHLLDTLYNLDSTKNLATNFNDYLKGFYLISKNQSGKNGAVLNLVTNSSSDSKLVLYYKTWTAYDSADIVNGDTLKKATNILENKFKTYIASAYTNGASSITNDYTNSKVSDDNTRFFVQGLAGPNGRITLRGLYDTWKDSGKVAINKAEIELAPDYSFLASYGITKKHYPGSLTLFFKDTTYHNIHDHGDTDTISNSNSFIGYYDNYDMKYRFNITPIMQRIVKKTASAKDIKIWNNFEMYLKDNKGIHSGGRVAFRKEEDIKLKVVYSIIK